MAQNILEQIMEAKRQEVHEVRQQTSLQSLQGQVDGMRRCRNFFSALTAPPGKAANLIAEVKKASPSAGVIREDFDPVAIARQYAEAGAAAISVLTDETFFGGRLEHIQQVRGAVSLPVLRKDFIIDPYQVFQSRVAGADAILLITACLRPADLMDLIILASQLTMTCLVEVHDADELLAVRSLVGFPRGGYVLVGINNRDLATFQVDLRTTLRLAEMVDDRRLLVSESGIHTRDDVRRLTEVGVQSILVGESLLRAPDIGEKVEELIG